MLRAQLGGGEAWSQLVELYDARLLFYLRRLLGDSMEAEDARQDVWLTVVRRLRTLEEPRAFRTWLYRVARHRGISLLRRRRAWIPIEETEAELVASEPADEVAFSPDDSAAMYAALEGLSAAHREVISLRYLGELSYEEIAAVVGCRVGTVRSRLHYATLALRKGMANTESGTKEQGA